MNPEPKFLGYVPQQSRQSCHTSFLHTREVYKGSFSNLSDIIRNRIILFIRVTTWNILLVYQVTDFILNPKSRKIRLSFWSLQTRNSE